MLWRNKTVNASQQGWWITKKNPPTESIISLVSVLPAASLALFSVGTSCIDIFAVTAVDSGAVNSFKGAVDTLTEAVDSRTCGVDSCTCGVDMVVEEVDIGTAFAVDVVTSIIKRYL